VSGAAFVEWLERLKGKKVWTRAQAALRRSLAFEPGYYYGAIPYVEPFVRDEGWRREAHYLVAGLYAMKKGEHREGRTLAAALGETAKERRSQSVERRFLALLDADRDQIAFRLRQATGLVEGGFDFARLLDDLLRWFEPNRRVQVRWAREFYGAGSPEQERTAEEVSA